MDFDRLLTEMESCGASDLFLNAGKKPAMRVQGEVRLLGGPATTRQEIDEILARLLAPADQQRFEAEGDLDLGYTPASGRGRYRLNIHFERGSPSIVARFLPPGSLELEDLHLPEAVGRLADFSRGLVLVTGATGSGKSTTLAALIHHINSGRKAHIVTIEDPVEFVHSDIRARITQREVGVDTRSFSTALRHVVRESPDVIMIGEMRDPDSMLVAITAATTGHLVLSTLHTIDASQSLQRIVSFFPENQRSHLLSDLSISLRGIVSLRLLPRQDAGGRVPAVELLTVTPAVARLIGDGRLDEIPDLMRSSNDLGVQTFNQSLLDLHRNGLISFDVGVAASTNEEEFRLAVGGMQTGVSGFQDTSETGQAGLLDMQGLLQIAIERGASDIHLSVGRPPILRVAGHLEALGQESLSSGDVRRLLNSILSSRQRSTLELERELDFSLSLESGIRFRVNAYFQKGSVGVALRTIPGSVPTPQQLGLPAALLELTSKPQGLVLVVGPTGSGKTTTVACLIDQINRNRSCHIITVEDPIEYSHQSYRSTIDQREVYSDTRSFAAALKYILRQDPDVILVGEMRDLETISAVLTAAETGHLVFATLHTNDAPQTVDRVVDVFPPHQQTQIRLQLAASLLGIVSQRLLPRANGAGRVAAFELLIATPAVRALIRDGKTHQIPNVISTGSKLGMVTMDRSLAHLCQHGLVSLESASPYMNDPRILGSQAPPAGEESDAALAALLDQDEEARKGKKGLGWFRG
ncbi:MAG: PilT/PilU family type 4a pilus ATPase [Armatimonadetes bacterium]|nr:PilT/PilU family type 4a pilus ATPase [Armatimonadota bacterium]